MKIQCQFLVVSCLFFAGSAMAVTLDDANVNASYGKGTKSGFNLSIVVTGVMNDGGKEPLAADNAVSETEAREFLERRFYIEMDEQRLPRNQIGTDDIAFYKIDTSTATVTDDSPIKVRVDATFSVTFASEGAFDSVVDGGEIPFKVCILGPDVDDGCETDEINARAIEVNVVVDDVTTNNNLVPGFRSLKAVWTAKTNPAFSGDGADQGVFSATSVNVVMIKSSSEITSLPALKFSGDADPVADSCMVRYEDQAQYACVSCDENVYLDIVGIKALNSFADKTIQIATKAINETQHLFTFEEAEVGPSYLMFTSYEPNAIQRSICTQAKAVDGATWSLLFPNEPEAKLGKECFVATAAFGTSMSSELNHLRWLRDNILVHSRLGRTFVRNYYQYGPVAAKYIKDRPVLRAMTRFALSPVVLASRVLQFYF